MLYAFIALVVVGILFLIIYNTRNARKSAKSAKTGGGSGKAGAEAASPAEEAVEAPEAVVSAEPGTNPDSFDPASLENAAAAGAIELDHPPAASPLQDLKAARSGSLDAQYRDALRRFAAEENGGTGGAGPQGSEAGSAAKSADEAYRDALRAMRRKE